MKWMLIPFVLVGQLLAFALATPYTLKVDGGSTTIEGTLDGGDLYLPLITFIQALGGGTRPVAFDYAAGSIQLTRGDGSKTVSAAFRIIGDGASKQPYIAAIPTARGLGFQTTLSGTTLTVSSQAAPPITPPAPTPVTAASLYPKGFTADGFEGVARLLIDEMNSTSPSSNVLAAVLSGSGLTVFGTQQRPADGDVLEIYQALHHPFATVLDLYTLRIGFQYRTFTPIDAYLSSLSGTAGPKLSAKTLPGLVGRALFGGAPSRSQVVLALVGAIGRERVRRGITLSGKLDPFWGDDALDPVQLRLLSAVLEAGTGPDKLAARHASVPWPQPVTASWARAFGTSPRYMLAEFRPTPTLHRSDALSGGLLAYAGDTPLAPQSITDFFSKVADRAVKEVVKEVYPGAENWLDNAVQDALGLPIALPISPALLEDVLKGDTEKIKATWSGLLNTALVETAKEGARAVFCGSIVLYGYHSKVMADQTLIHHRTAGDEAGTSVSKMTATLSYDGDYRDHVFKDSVKYISSLALKKPLTTVGELLERLGCELPTDDGKTTPVQGKQTDWEITGDITDHINGGKPDFADPTTDAGGVAHAQFRAIDELTPKAFRAESVEKTGNVFLQFTNLLPHKWWRVQQAAQYGQGTSADTKDQGKAGSSTQRLTVKYYEPPDLRLKFHSTLIGTGPEVNFKLDIDTDAPLKAKWSGAPNTAGSRFLGYTSEDSSAILRYEGRTFTAKCGLKIQSTTNGVLTAEVVTDNFSAPQLTVVLNPGIAMAVRAPNEVFVIPAGSGPNCRPAGGADAGGLWIGSWLAAYGSTQPPRIGALPGNAIFGLLLHANRLSGPLLLDTTVTGQADAFNAKVSDSTHVTLQVMPRTR